MRHEHKTVLLDLKLPHGGDLVVFNAADSKVSIVDRGTVAAKLGCSNLDHLIQQGSGCYQTAVVQPSHGGGVKTSRAQFSAGLKALGSNMNSPTGLAAGKLPTQYSRNNLQTQQATETLSVRSNARSLSI